MLGFRDLKAVAGSAMDVSLELREVRRSARADGYTLIWREAGHRLLSDQDDHDRSEAEAGAEARQYGQYEESEFWEFLISDA